MLHGALVFSGFIDRVPGLKLLVHHWARWCPFFEGRIRHGWAELGTRTTGDDPTLCRQSSSGR